MDLQHSHPKSDPAARQARADTDNCPRDVLADVSGAVAELLQVQDELRRRIADFEARHADAHRNLAIALNRATRAESYLEPFLRSRLYRTGWSLGLAARPHWLPQFEARPALPTAPPPPPAGPDLSEVASRLASLCHQVSSRISAAVPATVPVEPAPDSEMDLALRHLGAKGFRPRVILDVGSAKGYWSERTQWLHFPDADYYMIDPLDESQGHLRELAGRSPQFRPLQLAIGSQPGELAMNVTDDGDGSSLLAFPSSDSAVTRTVPIETLDRLLDDGRIAPADLVKIDVQGFEIEVLRGAAKLLGQADVFIIEVNLFRFMPGCPLAHEVVAFMADHGYRLYDLAGSLRRPYQNDLGQLDLVFVRNDSTLVSSNRWK